MTRKKKPAPKTVALDLPEEVLQQLVPGPLTPEAAQDLFLSFKKAVIERAMGAELGMHLQSETGASQAGGRRNHRNGHTGKTVLTDAGPIQIDTPRDRAGSFEPVLIGKHERRFTGFDDRIVAMYARGMTVREIQAYLAEMYGTEVSPDFISKVTTRGSLVRWRPCIRLSFLTHFASKSGKRELYGTRRCTSPWVCWPMALATSSVCGSRTRRVPSSG